VDVQTGKTRTLWKASFASYALDAVHGRLAVSGIPDPATWTGSLYLINTATGVQTKIQAGIWQVEPYPVAGQSFFVQEQASGGAAGKEYFLSAEGLLFPTEIHFGIFSTAPDGQVWVSLEGNRLLIYAPTGALLHTVDLPVGADDKSDQIIWRPDGSGLLLSFYTGQPFNVSSSSLVSVDIAGETAALVDQSSTLLSTLVLVSGGK